ncbi:MAG: 30S ribosomal protein S17 [Candidatus Doudnabacteria bacterium]|nr:30S ribosomal protein S17 [Candidatus Doudnabacteria bacterium]
MTEKIRRKLVGQVLSDKMKNTVVVGVKSVKVHPKYKKRYNVVKKFAAHNENNDVKLGSKVEIEETRPMSKTKHWQVTKIL